MQRIDYWIGRQAELTREQVAKVIVAKEERIVELEQQLRAAMDDLGMDGYELEIEG